MVRSGEMKRDIAAEPQTCPGRVAQRDLANIGAEAVGLRPGVERKQIRHR